MIHPETPTPVPLKPVQARQFVRWGLGIFLLYYLADCALDALLFSDASFAGQIFSPDLHEISLRILSGLALSAGLSYGWYMLKRARRANEALVEQHRRLQQAHHDLEMFSHALAHDLRGGLAGLRVAHEILAEEHQQKQIETPPSLRLIGQTVERLERTVQALVQLSNLEREQLDKQLVHLSSIVEAGLARRKTAHPQRRIDYQVEPGLMAWGDEGMLVVALENLVCNAVKYSANSDPAVIRFYSLPHARGTAFCLEDNGCGFPADCANRIFLPFQRLHRAGDFPGTGMGLAIVQRIIQRHGGEIWAEGRPGEGARLYFWLPEKS